ncbi:MAG TPA: GNAT family N-acetyltransferase [Candidatus Acidoferrum sp.]|jgi:phosphinothricin acetyltransferase|nr:GNAT family N-acetyltransferase [Candidatus Acidoferrum sp.]
MPAAELTIRSARSEDAEAIAAILNAAIADRSATAQLDPVTGDERRAWLRAHDDRHPVWIAADEEGVAGWFSISPWSDRRAYDLTAEVSVYVAPDRQRRGIGAKLMRHAIASAPMLEIEVFVARIFTHNPASIRLFERFDFQRWGVMHGVARLEGILRDVAILGRRV